METTEASELERLKQELQQEHDMHLRVLADFENYRRRIERDRASEAQRGKRGILMSLIELLDSFDRAMPHVADAPPSVAEGVDALHRQLRSLIETQGVTSFDAAGQPFDPAVHEAIGSEQSDTHAPGTVTDQVQRGYRWGEELLRPARVRVAR